MGRAIKVSSVLVSCDLPDKIRGPRVLTLVFAGSEGIFNNKK